MNLYEQMAALTAALLANTAALEKANGGAATTSTADAATTTTAGKTTGKTAGKTTSKAKGATREQLVAALTEVKEKFGAAEAKSIIAKLGAAKMADIADDKLDEGFKAAQAKLAASEEEDEGDGDDI